MSLTFTKLFSSITESTIWCEPASTRLVWITMLAMCDHMGRVHASVPGLANRARISVEDVEKALARFQEPDKYSRTPDYDGRRIEPIEGGWRLISYMKYRELGNPVRASLDSEGYVYFAGVPGGDRVKIGFSKNPWARLNTLRTTIPSLEILATEKATMAREKERHEEFKTFRVDGEWFSMSQSIASLIQALSTRDTRSGQPTTVVAGSSLTPTVSVKKATVCTEVDVEAEVEKEKSTAGRAARLPADWALPAEWKLLALKEQPTWNPAYCDKVAQTFRNYWIAKAGKDGAKLDWRATWHNWVLREGPMDPRRAPKRSLGDALKDDDASH